MNFINAFMGGPPSRGGGQRRAPQYHDSLCAYPAYMIERSDLEKGNRILLPPSTLNILSNQQIPYPMIFCLSNTVNNKQTFAGVLEFIAPEGSCYLPFWMFNLLELYEGQQLNVGLVSDMIKGKLIKIQPHETAFVDLPNPRAILEKELTNYICLHQGDTIIIEFMRKQYKIDILEVKPVNPHNAICCVDTDIEVDFAKPLDYVDMPLPSLTKKTSSVLMDEDKEAKLALPFGGKCVRIDGKKVDQEKLEKEMLLEKQKKQAEEEYDPRKHRLPNGIRKKIIADDFKGKGVKINQAVAVKANQPVTQPLKTTQPVIQPPVNQPLKTTLPVKTTQPLSKPATPVQPARPTQPAKPTTQYKK